MRSIGLLLAGLILGTSAQAAETLTFEDRVAAQWAVEEVYWKHRVWPDANPTPKPRLSAVLSDASVRARVTDVLRRSEALATLWQRPLTAQQLQAEMARMAANSKDPGLLRDLFAALHDDPRLIAETLARDTLTERLVRNWYTSERGDAKPFDDWWASKRAELSARVPDTQGSFAPVSVTAGDCVDDTWRNVPVGTPQARGSFTAVWTGTEMLVWGGVALNNSYPSAGYRYSPATDTWTTITGAGAPSGRIEHTAVWTGIEMIVFGGGVDDGGRYDPASDSWAVVPASGAGSRRKHSAVWTGSQMILWGGLDFIGNTTNTGARFTPSSGTWTFTSTSNAASARSGHTAVWTGTRMLVWGGSLEATGGNYDPSTDQWTGIPSSVSAPARSEHSAAWTGTQMIIWGGISASSGFEMNSGARFNPATGVWAAMTTASAPTARFGHTAVWTGSRMIVFGGRATLTGPVGTGGRYDPSANTWTTMSATTVRMTGHVAFWTGSEMIAWSGVAGGRYDPASNAWIPMAGVPNPAPRYDHTAVWTGTEMLVWGGRDAERTGSRFNPATDSWVEIPTTGAPSERYTHTAVWTGTEMIVWGGTNSSGPGGRYNPSTNTWTPTSTVNAPSDRYDHTAVWTGTEMVVWGGGNQVQTLDTGGRYNPALDTWQATSTVGAPEARALHSAVWTGAEMIVWGGSFNPFGTALLDTGGRYDPIMNDWKPTSTVNAPAAAAYHDAVWAGNAMIVLGGGSIAGGRYYPAADQWLGTTTAGPYPSSRRRPAIVWTGREAILWGGDWNMSGLSDGSRYYPSHDSDGWLAMSGVGAPPPRSGHTAVWTGTELVVFGGRDVASGQIVPYDLFLYCARSPHCTATTGICDDGDPCTSDLCDAGTGVCSHTLQGSAPPDLGDSVRLTRSGHAARITWNAPPSATGFDVLRGVTTMLPVGPAGGSGETCMVTDSTATQYSDGGAAQANAPFWYLVRGGNACGNGGYGFAAGGGTPTAQRVSASCP